MPPLIDTLDLDTLSLRAGDGRRLDCEIRIDPLDLAGMRYGVEHGRVAARLDASRMISGYALRLRFEAALTGTCMRCMAPARPLVAVDAREVDQPGAGEELQSPYLEGPLLRLADWAHDALVLATPAKLLCREDCLGLCQVCGANLNDADPAEHRHDQGTDSPWAKLDELRLR